MDQKSTAIEYADARRRVRATEELIPDGVRLRLPPMPLSHLWSWNVLVTGAVWCVSGVILGVDWLLHDRTPAGLRERGMIIAGTFFVAVAVHGVFESVCARWTEIEVRRGRVVLHCHGFPRRRRRREWVIEQVADVVYLRYWGVRLLDARGRSLYTISEGLAADQVWVATRLRELVGRMPEGSGARLMSCDDCVGGGLR